ncbi:MAG TPA: cation transporter [Deltaproteobacteria bacterium]|nr:cation transporter [Deltaproteobacteria bacterium]
MKYAACEKCARSVGLVNIVGNTMMILIKGYMGVVGGSKGLIADAIHSCADLLATIVMIIGLKISGREKDADYPYGYGKAEYLVAIVIYLFLFVIALYILYDGTMAIIEGRQVVPCMSAAWGAIFSIAINELMFRQSVCAGTQINSPSIVAKAWESRSDVLSSIAVLIGIIGAKMGFHFMDPLAAIAVGVIILKICIEMVKDATLNLMDRMPEEEDVLEQVRGALARVKDIAGIRDVHAREVGPSLEFEVSLNVSEHITVSQGERIKREAKKVIRRVMEKESFVRVMLFPVEVVT